MDVQADCDSGVLSVNTEMTIYSAADLKPALLAQTVVGEKVDLDLSQVREFDTAGLQLLLMLKRRSDDQLRIVSSSHAVRSALELCNLEALIDTNYAQCSGAP